ncbi:hypothetical protein 20Sep418_00061 [Pseudomonas phage 20Sep418]|uniref:Uncharacterized protein n=17 Tax=Viruses TaxID=10239 RepID=K4RLA6_9CAUD|nr:hypothetical protein PaP1_gp033 [Pseudomonas phage PaP1]YP_007236853.1 hypothetical protein BN405_2-10_Ab1_orf_32 [Pseudomonas phage vB_PaeM_C2-10_Ab1]YP_009287435.1 hypothetical protein BIZ94_gp160 [Pseudomonas phage vB_PaeM_MAG1]YP_009598085.1 hypothetical protein FDH21_gp033 [Pseudomonas phage Zigelbrucke]YP_009623444.1 hypothetical protein FDJ38_gp037 [Pseudomonas phage vB_PaeM_C2-10_Ab02]YP_010762589.1 hypothetical protein QE325_gp178 [Pseudomonas phage pPA-3099-2aT.2]YP_010763026.1 h
MTEPTEPTVMRIDDVIEALQTLRTVYGNLKVAEIEHGDPTWSYYPPSVVYLTDTDEYYMEFACPEEGYYEEIAVLIGG